MSDATFDSNTVAAAGNVTGDPAPPLPDAGQPAGQDEVHGGPLVAGETGGASGLRLGLAPLETGAIVEIGAWPNRLEDVCTRLGALAGTDLPGRPGRFAEGEAALFCWVAFGRFLWLSSDAGDVARLDEAFGADEASVVDLSSARHAVRVSGEDAIAVLNKAVAIDFSMASFPPGSLAQSVIHQMPVVLLRRSKEAFDLLCPASFEASFLEWLRDAALEFGYRVGEPERIV
ncbi:sarcosine oxidase subunit gamma [Stappia sp.]|uniref:sarcosine oxidase subunit gamma n=1 Tax=Stappia sp. TaxID=1870903 RepID=UPI003A99CEAF